MSAEISKIEEIFEEIISGKFNVLKIELTYDGNDLTKVFIRKLEELNFKAKKIKDVEVEPGYRVPAFYLKNDEAYFGWVFWEIFTENFKRKLFASAIKNQRGDWEIQITEDKEEIVYVNEMKKIEIDLSTMAW
ncbi:hypothetical protein [Candidatus Chrysopegis kryptomonas]|uniref:Uncharacterized protein n=1 Tax=Candidatus Chryseopegocella kryptomonas TaxID=1633643 RepID=A0A0N7MYB3_9BACT|nr:hypothetical protein [Candidatus Chrysopegis kryptomonas]CUT03763.1 hypothetical protein JGI23_01547 [Candidatus Chrysopegis kryptomonas]